MKKGIAPLIVGLFILAIAAMAEITYLLNYINQSRPIIINVRETEIIRGINSLEFAKQYLLSSALYSYRQASYDVANRGGYLDLSSNSYNCVPYWRIYSQEIIPDVDSSMKDAVSSAFTKYITSANFENVKIPTSFTVDVSNHNILSVNSPDTLQVGTENLYTAEELFSFSQPTDGRVFSLFSVAQNVEQTVNEVATLSNSYSDLSNKLGLIIDAINVNYESQNLKVTYAIDNIGSNDTNYAAKILVTVTDTTSQYAAYDFQTNTFGQKNLALQFYMLEGNSNNAAPTNSCPSIIY